MRFINGRVSHLISNQQSTLSTAEYKTDDRETKTSSDEAGCSNGNVHGLQTSVVDFIKVLIKTQFYFVLSEPLKMALIPKQFMQFC